MENDLTKRCPACTTTKPQSEFYWNAGRVGNYCKPCVKQKVNEHRKRAGAKSTEQVRAWRAAHPDEKERRKAGDIRYRTENRERCNKAARDCQARNRPHYAALNAAYRTNNPEKFVAYYHNRRARLASVGGSHTAEQIKELLRKQRRRCAYCKAELIGRKYHCDHITPICKGGSNDIANIQILCPPCNIRKNGADPIEFANRLGLLC